MHALVVAAAGQHAAGEAVHDHDFTIADDVVLIAGEKLLSLQGIVQVGHQLGVLGGVEVIDAELILDVFHALFQHADGALLVVHLVVDTLAHARGQLREDAVELGGTIYRAGDDERGTGFIDKNRVDLVHDAEVVAALHHIIEGADHVIAQVVKAQLVIGAVGNVAIVGSLALWRAHLGQDDAHGQAKPAVDTAHHLGVALCQVIVNGDDVDTLAIKGIEVGRQQRGQGLALTGAHLGDVAEVQGRTAHDLHAVVLLIEDAPGSLTDGGKSLEQDVIHLFAVSQASLELVGLCLKLVVRKLRVLILKGNYIVCHFAQALDRTALARAQQLGKSKHG